MAKPLEGNIALAEDPSLFQEPKMGSSELPAIPAAEVFSSSGLFGAPVLICRKPLKSLKKKWVLILVWDDCSQSDLMAM